MSEAAPKPRKRIAAIGCGYVGEALGIFLTRAGHDVHGTTTTPQRSAELRAGGITPHVVTVDDADSLDRVLDGARAAYVTIAAGRGGDYEKTYAEGLEEIVRACCRCGVGKLIYTSSTGVYTQVDGSVVDESTAVSPVDERTAALLRAERAVLHGHPDVEGIVVRLGGIYGPDRDLAGRVARAAGSHRDDGDHIVNLVHRDDIVAALARLLDHQPGGVFNLVDDHPRSRRELYDALIRHQGLAPITWTSPPGSPRGKRVSNARIKAALGLELRHPRYEPT